MHFSNQGKKALARIIKSHMNPKLELYENYKSANSNGTILNNNIKTGSFIIEVLHVPRVYCNPLRRLI